LPNGSVIMCENYFDDNNEPINLLKRDLNVIKNLEINDNFIYSKVGINPKKKVDILSFLEFV
jgi:adenine-specific DNA methylase